MHAFFPASEHGKPELPEQLRSQTGVWERAVTGVWERALKSTTEHDKVYPVDISLARAYNLRKWSNLIRRYGDGVRPNQTV